MIEVMGYLAGVFFYTKKGGEGRIIGACDGGVSNGETFVSPPRYFRMVDMDGCCEMFIYRSVYFNSKRRKEKCLPR